MSSRSTSSDHRASAAGVHFAANRVVSAEHSLARLLQEAELAHASVDRLLQDRAASPPPRSPSPTLRSNTRPTTVRADIQELQERLKKLVPGPMTRLAHQVVDVPATPGTEASTTRRAIAEYAAKREARRTDSARSVNRTAERRSQREAQEHAEARAAVVDLEAENAALRSALERQREDSERAASFRFSLEDARQREVALERQLASRDRELSELRFSLREAEAEKERLRTLLAGTVWFEHEVKRKY